MLSVTKKRKINPMLMNVIIVSALIHVAAGVILGGITIVRYVIPDDTKFEEPPVVEEEAPPPEVKVDIKQRPPQLDQSLNNLKMREVGNISVAAVNVDLPSMDQSFTVSSGLGGFGGGNLLGNTRGSLGIGMSDVSVFGLKTRAERILFAIDANRQMVTDAKGGLNSYQVIKEEITDMVGNLSAGTLFNVVIVDRRKILSFRPRLTPAGKEIHQELIQWIQPINADADNPGLEGVSGASTLRLEALKDEALHGDIIRTGHRGNETATLTQFALEQNVDAIFFVTGYHRGFERIRRQLTEREQQDWNRTVNSRDYQEQLAEHSKEVPRMEKRVEEALKRINAERQNNGLPPRVLGQRHGVYSNANELGLEWKTPHPGWRPVYWRDVREVERYFKKLIDFLYSDKGGTAPSINVILFLAGDEEMRKVWEDSLDDYTRFFDGDYRVIRGEDEIEDARSAKDTKN